MIVLCGAPHLLCTSTKANAESAITGRNISRGCARDSLTVPLLISTVEICRYRVQKPYLEILLRDGTAGFLLRVWSDHPSYEFSSQLRAGDFVEVRGDFFVSPSFGLEARCWTIRFLTAAEKSDLLAGPVIVQEKQRSDYSTIESFTASIGDPRLRALCVAFLHEFGDRMRRAAGARNYHHARHRHYAAILSLRHSLPCAGSKADFLDHSWL